MTCSKAEAVLIACDRGYHALGPTRQQNVGLHLLLAQPFECAKLNGNSSMALTPVGPDLQDFTGSRTADFFGRVPILAIMRDHQSVGPPSDSKSDMGL